MCFDRMLEEIPRLRKALETDGGGDDGVSAVLSYLENYRARIEEDIRRVKRFVEGVPPRVTVALAPEVPAGTPSLVALAQLANSLITPRAMEARVARGANIASVLKKRAPLKGGRSAHKKSDEAG